MILSKSNVEQSKKLLRAIYGIVFFGVPNEGMDISSLIAMVQDRPNRFLIESIGINSQILTDLKRGFHTVLDEEGGSEVFCFYETLMSPTAKEV